LVAIQTDVFMTMERVSGFYLSICLNASRLLGEFFRLLRNSKVCLLIDRFIKERKQMEILKIITKPD